MKSEDLYNAVTELPDRQVLEGEKPMRAERRVSLRRLSALAAVLAVLAAAGILLLPKLTRERTSGTPADTGAPPQTETTQPPAESTEAPAPFGTPELSQYSLATASYPKMAPYPNEMDYRQNDNFDYEAFDTAWELWRRDRSDLRSDVDYTKGLDAYLKKVIPELLRSEEAENRVVSPLNLYMALAMLAETTEGSSHVELMKLLEISDLQSLRDRANALWRACYSDDRRQTCLLGASLWLRDDTAYNADTLDILASNYYSSVYAGPMGAEDYNEALRNWTNAQTGGLLADQIEGMEMTSETVMALITTIYLKAPWAEEFYQTEQRSFHAPSGDRELEFMTEQSTAACYFGKGFTAAGKSLKGGGDMFFLLPDEGVSLETLLEREETIRFLTDAAGRSQTENRGVTLTLTVPKFDVSSQLNLEQSLEALGVRSVFDPESANFSPLLSTAERSVYLTQATHGARVLIDEKGVTAAAFTEMLAGEAMPPEEQVELVLNRPFLFVITNNDGLPLFVGVVNEP